MCGQVFLKFINFLVYKSLREENITQLRTKNYKLRRLIGRIDQINYVKISVPIKNLSSSVVNLSLLKSGLNQSFINKHRYIKRNLAGVIYRFNY